MRCRKPPLPALTVKLSKYNVDDVALGVCKTGAEEAGVTEVRTSLSEKKFALWREIKVSNMIKLLSRKPTALRLVNPSAAKIKIFTASDRKSGSAGMPRPNSYAVFCLKKKNPEDIDAHAH